MVLVKILLIILCFLCQVLSFIALVSWNFKHAHNIVADIGLTTFYEPFHLLHYMEGNCLQGKRVDLNVKIHFWGEVEVGELHSNIKSVTQNFHWIQSELLHSSFRTLSCHVWIRQKLFFFKNYNRLASWKNIAFVTTPVWNGENRIQTLKHNAMLLLFPLQAILLDWVTWRCFNKCKLSRNLWIKTVKKWSFKIYQNCSSTHWEFRRWDFAEIGNMCSRRIFTKKWKI